MRYFLAITVIVVYIAFCLLCWVKYRQRERVTQSDSGIGKDAILVAYASQTGNAEKLAQQSVLQLEQAGLSCKLLSLHKVD